MKIIIDKDIYIDKDPLCYAVRELTGTTDKNGVEKYITHGYFNRLTPALLKVRTIKAEKQLDKDEVPLSEYIQELRNQTEEIRDLMRGLEDEEE